MVTASELERMKQQNIETINQKELKDLSEISIRQDLPYQEKILDFLEQVKNPYCFRCKTVPVKICFSDEGPTLGQTLQDYFIRIKQG